MIRVIIAEDEPLLRSGLTALAEHDGDITVVAEAADGGKAVARTRELRPDVVLMDIRMPGIDGVTATELILADPALSAVRVLVLTTFAEEDTVLDAIAAGAAGYLLKDVAPADLRAAIRRVAAGEPALSPSVTSTVMRALTARRRHRDPALIAGLAPREREVLAAVGRGLTNAEIGAHLYISPETARTYVSRLLTKLDARDRARLVIIAYESGLLEE